jgi:CRP-like cAMP-binding protein
MSDLRDLALTTGEGISIIRCQPRQDIYYQGDPADAIYYVRHGQFKLSAVYPTGKVGIIAVANAGDFFGENCLRGDRSRLFTASAITDGSLLRITAKRAAQLLNSHAEFASRFIDHLLTRNSRLEGRVLNHLFSSSEARLARVLLDLAAASNAGGDRIVPRPSHEMLSALVGTTRPRISSFMRRFRERGFIKSAGDVLHVHGSLWHVINGDTPTARRFERNNTIARALVARAPLRMGTTP